MNSNKTLTAYPTPFLEYESVCRKINQIHKDKTLNTVVGVIHEANADYSKWLLSSLKRNSPANLKIIAVGNEIPKGLTHIFLPHFTSPPFPMEKEVPPEWFTKLLKDKGGRTPPLHISYPLLDSLGNELRRSPWLERYKFDFHFDSPDMTPAPWRPKSNIRTDEGKGILKKKLEGHVFSPTEFETYITNPFQHFCRYLLKIRPADKKIPELDGGIMGQLIHRILEKIFGEIKKETWMQNEPAELIEQGIKIADQVMSEWEAKNLKEGSSLWKHRKERIHRTLKALLEQEAVRIKEDGFKLEPTHFEKRISPPLELKVDGETVKISGVIDRIDVDPTNQKFLVIDYKTGSRVTSSNKFQSGEALQLPLYVKAVKENLLKEHTAIGGIFFRLHDLTRKEGFVNASDSQWYSFLDTRSKAAYSAKELNQIMYKAEKKVGTIVKGMKDGHFSQQAKKCDSFCDYKDICRCET